MPPIALSTSSPGDSYWWAMDRSARRLETEIESLGLEGVTLTGFMQMDSLPAYYALASALVHPAHKDTWGLVVNEAMAVGLPVVVSRQTGCVNDLVREGENGYTFDSSDLDALTQLLGQLHASRSTLPAMGDESVSIISAWNLDRFASGLMHALEAGAPRADRPLSLDVRLLYALLRRLASPDSLHRVPS